MKISRCLILAAIVGVMSCSAADARDRAPLQVVNPVHKRPAGTTGDVYFGSVLDTTIGDSGAVAFVSLLWGDDVRNDHDGGLWLGKPEDLSLIARVGDEAPDLGGRLKMEGFYFNQATTVVNARNDLLYGAILSGDGVTEWNNRAIYRHQDGASRLIARQGDAAPGLDNFGFTYLMDPKINDRGNVALPAQISGNGALGNGIWFGTPGAMRHVASIGSAAPGIATPARFVDVDSAVRLNNHDQLAFGGEVVYEDLSQTHKSGIWFGAQHHVRNVVLDGDAAPGASAGAVFAEKSAAYAGLTLMGMNDRGQLSFRGELAGPEIHAGNDSGIWVGEPDDFRLVVGEGNAAPGAGSSLFDEIPAATPIGFNNRGVVAFIARLTGDGVDDTNDTGIWAGASGSLRLIAREGDAAFGAEAGAVFDDFLAEQGGFAPLLNDRGDIAFSAYLRGDGINGLNAQGVWGGRLGEDVRLLLREGDQLDRGDGELNAIDGINFSWQGHRHGGLPQSLNADGEVVAHVGIQHPWQNVVVKASVPEPSAIFLASTGCGAAVLAMVRRKRIVK